MRSDDPNLPLLLLIADALGDLREELVFVGGCAAGLLLDEAARVALTDRITIRLISAPAFVATKLEAFATRGRLDFLSSHDLEDVLNVIEGRLLLPDELRAANADLRFAVQAHVRRLLDEPYFVDNLAGLVSDPDLSGTVLARLRSMVE